MNEADILNFRTRLIGRPVVVRGKTESTNSDAKTLAAAGCTEGTLVIAEEQTAGRGRQGRTWHSRAGENLTFSFVLRPPLPDDKLGVIPLLAGLAAARGVARVVGLSPVCKWPNDLLLNGRKFCGILAESTPGVFRSVVVGIGMNVNQTSFPPPLEGAATSLRLVTGKEIDRLSLLGGILEELDAAYETFLREGARPIIDAWIAASGMIGAAVAIDRDGGLLRGTATGVADDGALIVTSGRKETRVVAGEVSLSR